LEHPQVWSDVSSFSCVIHYDFPVTPSDFMRIAGKSPSRFARREVAIWFVTTEDYYKIHEVEEALGYSIAELPMNIADLI
jgi:superfamily II DNA/RNA helicase